MADLAVFWRAERGRKALAFEALWELTRARLATLGPAERYTRGLGRLDAPAAPSPTPEQEQRAAVIGHVVERVAAVVPFRALCLQQALAARRMLDRRGVPATVYLGLALDRKGPQGIGEDHAHAWVRAGDKIVSGRTDLSRYAVVGTFT